MSASLDSPQAPSIAPTIRSASSVNKGLTRQLNLASPSPPRQALNTNLTALLRSASASKPFALANNSATTCEDTTHATAKMTKPQADAVDTDIFAASRARKQHQDRMLRLRRLVSVALVVMASSAVSFYLLSASEHDMAYAKLRAKYLKGSGTRAGRQHELTVPSYPGPYHAEKIKKLAKKKFKSELKEVKRLRKLEERAQERDRKRARVRERLLKMLSKDDDDDDAAMEVEQPLDVMAMLGTDSSTSLSSLSSISSFDSWSLSSSSSSSMDWDEDNSFVASAERDIHAAIMQTNLYASFGSINEMVSNIALAFDTANEEADQAQTHQNNGVSGEMEHGDDDDDNPFVDRPAAEQEDEDPDQTRQLISFLTAAGMMLLVPPTFDGSEILHNIDGATSLERRTRSRREERGRSAFWALGLAVAGLTIMEDPEGEEVDMEEEWKGIQEEEESEDEDEEEEEYTLAGRLKLQTLLAHGSMSTALAVDIMAGRSTIQRDEVQEETAEERQNKRRDTLSRAMAAKLALGASKSAALEIMGKHGSRLGNQPAGKKAPFNFDPDANKYDLDDFEDDEYLDDDSYEVAEKNARTAIKLALEAVEATLNAAAGYEEDLDRDGESLFAELNKTLRGTGDENGDTEMEQEEKRQLYPERMGRFDKKDRVTNWLEAVQTAPRTPGRTQGAGQPFKDISATPAINVGRAPVPPLPSHPRPAQEAQNGKAKGTGKLKTSPSRPRRRCSEARKAALEKAKDASKVERLRKKEQEKKEKRKKGRENEKARLAPAAECVKKKSSSVGTRKRSRPSKKQLESLKKATEASKLKRLQRKIAANGAA